MLTALVTGASRGLGFEWTRQLLAEGWHVAATCPSLSPDQSGQVLNPRGERVAF